MTHISQTKIHDILGVRFDFIDDNVATEAIERWKQNEERHYVTHANPHTVMLCQRDIEMQKAIKKAEMILPDGIGIILAAKILGYAHNSRVTGSAFMLRLCDWGRIKEYRHFFYGGAEGVADMLARKLSEKYPGLQVVGTYCPPFKQLSEEEDKRIIEIINTSKPDILWVGLGAPKQEKWMANHLDKISATAMIGVGAAFDFQSGNVKWAPAWVRNLGMEWAWRLIHEPRRMWKRYLLNGPIYLVKVVCQRLRILLGHRPIDQS